MNEKCPKCGADLAPVTETPNGRKLQRCSTGKWNSETHKTEGCDFVKWIQAEPQELDEKCPKCGAKLVMSETRFGKKFKKCSTNTWNRETRQAEGCDYIEWLGTKSEELDEKCPECGANLVLTTTSNGKRLKKCSTGGWDSSARQATGCTYVEWLKAGDTGKREANGEEFLPPPPEE